MTSIYSYTYTHTIIGYTHTYIYTQSMTIGFISSLSQWQEHLGLQIDRNKILHPY